MDVDTIVMDIVHCPVNLIVCIHVAVHVVENLSKHLFNRGLYVFNKIIFTSQTKYVLIDAIYSVTNLWTNSSNKVFMENMEKKLEKLFLKYLSIITLLAILF